MGRGSLFTGSGKVIILIVVLPVQEHLSLVFKLEDQRNRKPKLLTSLREKADFAMQEIDNKLNGSNTQQEKGHLKHCQSGLDYFKILIIQLEKGLSARRNRDFQKAVSILNRNPSAVSHKYREAFAQLAHLKNDRQLENMK